MSLTQKPILQAASARVRAGGRLVYAVCSPEPEEGVDVVNAFLEQNSEFRLEKSFECAPPVGQEDAFYAARLIKGEP
jgi:16S rRNA (cytosine967-C5)-methyltransferase